MIQAQATAHVNRILHSRGYKGNLISVSKLKSMGFTPLMELPQGVYWQQSDLEKAAEITMQEHQKEVKPAKVISNPKGAPKVKDHLESIENMLTMICKELNIKE